MAGALFLAQVPEKLCAQRQKTPSSMAASILPFCTPGEPRGKNGRSRVRRGKKFRSRFLILFAQTLQKEAQKRPKGSTGSPWRRDREGREGGRGEELPP